MNGPYAGQAVMAGGDGANLSDMDGNAASGHVLAEPAPLPSPLPFLYVVAAALVDSDGRILVQQRPEGTPMAGLWEFPGGKMEQGETPEAALIRELHEELGIEVEQACLAPACFASEPLGQRHLLLLLYVCRKWRGTPTARHASAMKWVRPVELHGLDMPPADKPLIGLLENMV